MNVQIKELSKVLLPLLLSFQLTAAALSQHNIMLKGRVEDPAGAAIPKVQISVIGKAGSLTAMSDENGDYELTLPEGVYQISTAKLPGFAATKKKKVLVKAGAPVIYNIRPKIDLSTAECVLRITSN
jgi:hypothetical protein